MTALTLARAGDLDRLLPMVAACHAETGHDSDEAMRRDALAPLLEGSPHGVVYLIGPPRAPIGYALLSFGWSLARGGLTGHLAELHIRRAVRGRGIGSEVLVSLPRALAGAGLRSIDVEVDTSDARARAFFSRLRFRPREDCVTMTLALAR